MIRLLELVVNIREALVVHPQIKFVSLLPEHKSVRCYLHFVGEQFAQRLLLVDDTIISEQSLFASDD